MFWTNIKRIFRSGFASFWRNGFISIASVLVMVITLFVVGTTVFIGAIFNSSLQEIKNKVDVTVYFVKSASLENIEVLQKSLNVLPEVASTSFTTAEQALINFKLRHVDDEYALQALDELDSNPLQASLDVKAKDPSQYKGIADFLQNKSALSSNGTSIIDHVNYYQNKTAIDTLDKIIRSADTLGLALTIFLIIISILITYNTIRLSIFMAKDEISVMRLVGASRTYIRGPFVVSGVMYGVVSAVITLIIFFPITIWLGTVTANFFIDLNIFHYYMSNFFEIFGILLLSGIGIGAFSSWLSARRYLKV